MIVLLMEIPHSVRNDTATVIHAQPKNPYIYTMKVHADHNYFVYILTNKSKTVLYTGVTNELAKRLYWHQNPASYSKAFTARYKCTYLLYFEHHFSIENAIKREKEIKGWSRKKKENLINSFNPSWSFLNDSIVNGDSSLRSE